MRMVITIAPFMGWALTLQIILSRCFWHVLFRIGVHGKDILTIRFNYLIFMNHDRCDAHWNKLDEGGGRRSHELTEALFKALGTKALWDDYGIIDGVMVCTSIALFF